MKLLQLTEEYSRPTAIKSAIQNRRRITFYYAGPRRGKDSVKAGGRYEVEPVAMGLTNKGNVAIRGWVNNTSSVTKTGFQKGQWRTFLLSRMHQLNVTDDIFGDNIDEYKEEHPGYKEGDDGSFSVTYVTPDWNKKPYRRKFEKELSRREREKKEKEMELQKQKDAEIEKATEEPLNLPQPKPQAKPNIEPEKLPIEPEQPEIEPQPTPTPTPILGNEPQPEENEPNDELEPAGDEENKEEDLKLQESIKKIKHLMFF